MFTCGGARGHGNNTQWSLHFTLIYPLPFLHNVSVTSYSLHIPFHIIRNTDTFTNVRVEIPAFRFIQANIDLLP